MSCRPDLLDAHQRGELHGAAAERVVAHLATCSECRAELAWLRAEHRLFAERARRLTPPYVQLAKVRGKVDGALRQRRRAQKRARATRSGGAVLSAFAAVLVAFVVSTLPGPTGEAQLGWLDPATCSSIEQDGTAGGLGAFCVAASGGHELLAAVENEFGACLVATPDALPESGSCR